MSFNWCIGEICIPIPVIIWPPRWPDPTPEPWTPTPWVTIPDADGPRPHPWINDLPLINTISVLTERIEDEVIRNQFTSLIADAAGNLALQLPIGELTPSAENLRP